MGARLAMHTAHQRVLTKPLTRARREVGNSSTPAVTAVSPIPCVCAQRQTQAVSAVCAHSAKHKHSVSCVCAQSQTQALRQLCVPTAPNTSTPSAVCAHSAKHKHSVSRP